ncbi:MAG: branched-chain amino acid ABC transporter ATP-binding protein/permease [Pseudaminobacter sp.]
MTGQAAQSAGNTTVTRPHKSNALAWAATLSTLAAVLIFPLVVPIYLQHLGILVLMYIALSGSWNIIGGFTGYESFGHITFYGVGAYAGALLLVNLGWSPLLTAPLAGLIACGVAVIASPSLRVRGAYFAITTLALSFVAQVIVSNLDGITGGGSGIFLPLPPWGPEFLKIPFYYAMLVGALGTVGLCFLIKRSRFGLRLELIREDEEKAEALGVDTARYKIIAFVLSAFFPGFVGAIHAYYLSYLSPAAAFNLVISINILLFAFFGGRGTVLGPVLGALILIPTSHFLNTSIPGELHQLLFGVILVVTVMVFPGGVISIASRFRRPVTPSLSAGPAVAAPVIRHPAPSNSSEGKEAAGEQILLNLNNVSKKFGGVVALANCSLAIRPGTVTGLIGPNGSGKSSVLNIITGFYSADAGDVRFRNHSLLNLKPHRIRMLGIARSFQETRTFAGLSVLENVAAAAPAGRAMGLLEPRLGGHSEIKAREYIELLGLTHVIDLPAGELSYGQQKLVDLAGVFLDHPQCVLLDEPAAGINPVLAERMMTFIAERNYQEGATILIIDHDMGVIMSYCDPVIVMDAGKPLVEGPPMMVQNDRRVLDAYLGE